MKTIYNLCFAIVIGAGLLVVLQAFDVAMLIAGK